MQRAACVLVSDARLPSTSIFSSVVFSCRHSSVYTSTHRYAHSMFHRPLLSDRHSSPVPRTKYKYCEHYARYHQHPPLFIAILSLTSTALVFPTPSPPTPYAKDPREEPVGASCCRHHDPCAACGSRNLPALKAAPQEANQGPAHCRSRGRSPCNTRVVANGMHVFLNIIQTVDKIFVESRR